MLWAQSTTEDYTRANPTNKSNNNNNNNNNDDDDDNNNVLFSVPFLLRSTPPITWNKISGMGRKRKKERKKEKKLTFFDRPLVLPVSLLSPSPSLSLSLSLPLPPPQSVGLIVGGGGGKKEGVCKRCFFMFQFRKTTLYGFYEGMPRRSHVHSHLSSALGSLTSSPHGLTFTWWGC